MTYFPIATSTDGISNFDHQVIHFLVSLPLEFASLQKNVTKLKLKEVRTKHLHAECDKNERKGKDDLLSHPLFHGDQAFDLLDTSQQLSCKYNHKIHLFNLLCTIFLILSILTSNHSYLMKHSFYTVIVVSYSSHTFF